MQLRRNARLASLALIAGALSCLAAAQSTPPSQPSAPAGNQPAAPAQAPGSAQQPSAPSAPETHITPAQAKELFASVGQILQFASNDTKLPIRHQVKSRLTTRAEVDKYLLEKMNDDKDAKRMEREEIVLKKFGLLDADFQLRPFLVKLLDEQIAAYYDSKTKTVNLLDWIAPDQQKPVLAHELTHALQDQRVHLDKWENVTSDDLSHSYASDQKHVATDEDDTAREAVLEGQAMAVFVDYSLAPAGESLRKSPQLVESVIDTMADDGDQQDPVLSRAPLLLQESLLFPYKYGLKFEAEIEGDNRDPSAAFAGVLDRPPASSFEIMNPRAYEHHVTVPVLNMPDIHPVVDADYAPYDIGVMGELDVRILSLLFGGQQAATELTPQWDGGIYYAAQRRDAPDKNSTASVALFYLSQWKSEDAAEDFAKIYADELAHKYSRVQLDANDESGPGEQVYQTNEGPVLIATVDKDVFISESFPLPMARKLETLMVRSQIPTGGGEVASNRSIAPTADLTGNLVHFMASCGIMKVALRH
ncbi:MAG TPA: hypothetical protein VMD25_02680 [Acidobacteriaceae bacterium]|nr:hypothetical protein [Acidobacteriaceae bacterium]